jgi:3D (Asp-Asp-Asp) domain-containing protein
MCLNVLDTAERIASISCNNVKTTKVIYLYKEDPEIQTEEILDEIEQIDEEIKEEVKEIKEVEVIASGILTKRGGVNYFDGHKETYYNLPMKKVVSNAQKRGIKGNYWEREDGAKMLGDYIMVAADQSIHPYGSIVATSLGDGIVVDTGTFIKTNPQQIDIATTW